VSHDADITLSAFAAALGELEPAAENDEETAAHSDCFYAFDEAAQFLPVRTAADAALALSLASKQVGDIEASELTAAQLQERVAKANRSLEAVMRWLIECHGVKPLWTCWKMAAFQ